MPLPLEIDPKHGGFSGTEDNAIEGDLIVVDVPLMNALRGRRRSADRCCTRLWVALRTDDHGTSGQGGG